MEYKLLAPRQENLSYIEQVFSNRGMDINDINHYLQTSEEDIINPNTILNIHKGVQMLIKHIFNQDKTLIQIDSDVDGYGIDYWVDEDGHSYQTEDFQDLIPKRCKICNSSGCGLFGL